MDSMSGDETYMPLYPADYLRDTIGLTHSQHGAYLLTIMKYWIKGEALTQGEFLEACGRSRDRVAQFFVWEGGRWHHKRVDEELAKARDRAARAHRAAQMRWRKSP